MISPFYKQVIKMIAFIVTSMALCRFTHDAILPIMVIAGVWCALAGKVGMSLVYFTFFPFLVMVNPGLLPKDTVWATLSLRLGPFLIGLALALVSFSRRGNHRLPFGSLFFFLLVAFVSSMQGWSPQVSYLKLLNFIVFLLGIWLGTQNLQDRPRDTMQLRAFFLALCVVIIVGSICLIPFPSISYLTSLRYAIAQYGTEYANTVFQDMKASGSKTLFSGILNHSQALAPILVCCFTWIILDMLFVERRFSKFHLVLLICALPLFYMTRSRVALCSLLVALCVIYFYASRRIALSAEMYRNMRRGMTLFLGLIIVVAVIAQIRTGAIMEWVRKTNDVAGDTRSLSEAFTSSRQGLIDESISDFKRNIWLGSGFQVSERIALQMKHNQEFVLSAPIEKGLLPLMVLGETGIVGCICFGGFLIFFFVFCAHHQYYATISLFLVYLATNIGEASFFSPGGAGGIEWMICLVGGFLIDTCSIYGVFFVNRFDNKLSL